MNHLSARPLATVAGNRRPAGMTHLRHGVSVRYGALAVGSAVRVMNSTLARLDMRQEENEGRTGPQTWMSPWGARVTGGTTGPLV